MADLTITAANVDWVSGSKSTKDAAETIAVGDCVYDTGSSTYGVASNGAAAKDSVVGIALNAATAAHPVTIAETGAGVGFGAILTVGEMYVLSATGKISPIGDKASSDYVSYIGYGDTTSNMKLTIHNTGRQVA